MLANLRIQNVALIDELDVAFSPGFNVLSGETGAGKSIILGALGFALGDKPGRDFIRAGASMASVEVLFDFENDMIQSVSQKGVEFSGDSCVHLFRSISANGKYVCRVNGRAVTLGMLRDITTNFIDTHSQHEHHSLLDPSRHIVLLDRLCFDEISGIKSRLSDLYDEYKAIISRLSGAIESAKHREERYEELTGQIIEIRSAKLIVGEEEELIKRRERVAYIERLSTLLHRSLDKLTNFGKGDSAINKTGVALASLNEAAELDSALSDLRSRLEEAATELNDISEELIDYYDSIDLEPASLDEIGERLAIIRSLKRKYTAFDIDPTVTGILAYAEKAEKELELMGEAKDDLKQLAEQKKTLEREIMATCVEISNIRKKTAELIERDIAKSLQDLGMKHAQFSVVIERRSGFTRNGFDKVEFYISPNIGEALKPLAQTASGGEMSRVMLALKASLASAETIETFIFDEIDSGISGKTAQMVAEKIALLSKKQQILCITHLPQIAAMADNHYLIEKLSDGGRARTTISELDDEAAVREIARLMSGANITNATLEAALEMKNLSKIFKKNL